MIKTSKVNTFMILVFISFLTLGCSSPQSKEAAKRIVEAKEAVKVLNQKCPIVDADIPNLRTDRLEYNDKTNTIIWYQTLLNTKANDTSNDSIKSKHDYSLIKSCSSDFYKKNFDAGITTEFHTYGSDNKLISKKTINKDICTKFIREILKNEVGKIYNKAQISDKNPNIRHDKAEFDNDTNTIRHYYTYLNVNHADLTQDGLKIERDKVHNSNCSEIAMSLLIYYGISSEYIINSNDGQLILKDIANKETCIKTN